MEYFRTAQLLNYVWRGISAGNVHRVAKVTSRRARKGFTIRYHPDTRLSAALYRGLN